MRGNTTIALNTYPFLISYSLFNQDGYLSNNCHSMLSDSNLSMTIGYFSHHADAVKDIIWLCFPVNFVTCYRLTGLAYIDIPIKNRAFFIVMDVFLAVLVYTYIDTLFLDTIAKRRFK